jgi:3-oxoacyl-[acyl-carrier protein] reductase
MDLGLKGRVALIGGSSKGLGRAVAEALAAEGCDVALNARSEPPLEAAAREIGERHGVRAVPVAADLSSEEGAERLLARTLDAFGRVDVLVTNNGGPPPGAFQEHDLDAWRRAYHLTLESVLVLARGVLPGMRERGWGRILNVTSIAVKQPVDGLMLSNSIRAAVTGFARTLANEVAAEGITVNNLMPGFTRTERLDELAEKIAADTGGDPADAFASWAAAIPLGRVAEPAEFGAVAAFLASDKASYVTGQSIAVDGGWIRGLL